MRKGGIIAALIFALLLAHSVTGYELFSGETTWTSTEVDSYTYDGANSGLLSFDDFFFLYDADEAKDVAAFQSNNIRVGYSGAWDNIPSTLGDAFVLLYDNPVTGTEIGHGTIYFYKTLNPGYVNIRMELASFNHAYASSLSGNKCFYINRTTFVIDEYYTSIETCGAGTHPVYTNEIYQNLGGQLGHYVKKYGYPESHRSIGQHVGNPGSNKYYGTAYFKNTWAVNDSRTEYPFTVSYSINRNFTGYETNSSVKAWGGSGDNMWNAYTEPYTTSNTSLSLPFYVNKLTLRAGSHPDTWTEDIWVGSPLSGVNIYGWTVDAETNSAISDVDIALYQSPTSKFVTSDTDGLYYATGLYASYMTEIQANKTGYAYNTQYVTFYENGTYLMNISLINTSGDYNPVNQSAVVGIVYESPYNTPLEGATVNIWNGTWSASTTTSSTGFYNITVPVNGSYTMNVTKTNYRTSNNEVVITPFDGWTQKDFLIEPICQLTVWVKDSDSFALITNATVVVNGETKLSTGGYATFTDLSPDSYEINIEAGGYYPSVTDKFVDDMNETTTVYLIAKPTERTGAGAQYPSHLVEIKIVDIYGNPLKNVNITAVGVETSGSWSWLSSIFGFENVSEIQNTTMEGATGDTGSVSFMMVETIKYHLLFQNASQGINETTEIYPKEEQYIFVVPTTPAVEIGDVTSWNLSVNEVNSTHAYLNLSYVDELNETQNVTFYVFNASQVEIYNETFIDQSNVNASYLVTTEHNASYFWGFVANGHYGTHEEYKFIRFTAGRLIDLGLENESYYSWISIALLFFVSLLFSVTTAKFGYVTIPLMSAFFWWIGWLQVSSVIILSALALGVLLYMGKKEREEGL